MLYNTAWQFVTKTGLGGRQYREYSKSTREAMRYIIGNLSMELNVEKVADELFLSPSSLSKRFVSDTGITLGRFIDRQVLKKARQLLIGSDMTMHEISDTLGFCDQFYFARKFKSYYRTTPTEYRKQHRKF